MTARTASAEASSLFLKKRTKKLFSPGCFSSEMRRPPDRMFKQQRNKGFLVLFFKKELLAFCVLAFAPIASAQAAEVSAPILALDQALTSAQKTGSTPFPARYKALAPAVDQAFDLPQILQTIVGLRWPSIEAGQKARLLATFRAYTIASYVANFDSDSGDTLKILPEMRSIGADRVVETEIVPKSGDPTRIDYVMRSVSGAWRAIDVLEQGTISQAAVQRSDFRSLVAAGADKLTSSLQAKVDTLSGGTIDASAGPKAGGQPGTP